MESTTMVRNLTEGVEVRISGGTPLEVLAKLAAWGMRCYSRDSQIQELASQILKLEEGLEFCFNDEPTSSEPPADPTGSAAGKNGPSTAPSENAAPAPNPKPESAHAPTPTTSKAPSLEDIRAKGIEAAKKHGQPAIKAILKELGAANMTALSEDKRAEFLAKLEGLGESNA